jgi:hypothetical protein
MASANGGKLNRDVSAHGTDANHGDATILQPLARHKILLTYETIV